MRKHGHVIILVESTGWRHSLIWKESRVRPPRFPVERGGLPTSLWTGSRARASQGVRWSGPRSVPHRAASPTPSSRATSCSSTNPSGPPGRGDGGTTIGEHCPVGVGAGHQPGGRARSGRGGGWRQSRRGRRPPPSRSRRFPAAAPLLRRPPSDPLHAWRIGVAKCVNWSHRGQWTAQLCQLG